MTKYITLTELKNFVKASTKCLREIIKNVDTKEMFAAGIPLQRISEIKSGAYPDFLELGLLCRALNISADHLLGLEETFNATISSKECEMIKKYRELNAPGKKLINTTINTLLISSAESGQNKNKIS